MTALQQLVGGGIQAILGHSRASASIVNSLDARARGGGGCATFSLHGQRQALDPGPACGGQSARCRVSLLLLKSATYLQPPSFD